MTIKDINRYINAGFTADEIKKLFKESTEKNPKDKKLKEKKETSDDFKTALDGLNAEIKSLKELIEDSNIRGNVNFSDDENVDDILASIINPNNGKGDN